MHTDMSWAFEVRLENKPDWLIYDQTLFPAGKGEWNAYLGVDEAENELEDPQRFHDLLNEAAGPIRAHVGPTLTHLRLVMWRRLEPTGAPALVMEASPHQLSLARLWADTEPVHRALHDLRQARRNLRSTIAHVAVEPHWVPEQLLHTAADSLTEAGLPPERMLEFLRSVRLAHQIQTSMSMGGYSTAEPYGGPSEDLSDSEDLFFWAGCAHLGVSPDGTITVRMDPDAGEWGYGVLADATDEEHRQAEQESARRAQLALHTAKTLTAKLTHFNLEVRTADGAPATAEDLATGALHRIHPKNSDTKKP